MANLRLLSDSIEQIQKVKYPNFLIGLWHNIKDSGNYFMAGVLYRSCIYIIFYNQYPLPYSIDKVIIYLKLIELASPQFIGIKSGFDSAKLDIRR